MKKNTMMRLAAILLVSVLLTTSVIGGTFAKYTTSDDATDTARVAKWGVVVEAKTAGYSLFAKEYAKDDNTVTLSGDYSVQASSSDYDKLLAPGTDGEFTGIVITGTPEVAVKLNIVGEVELTGNWVDQNGDYYCPISVTVGNATLNGNDYPDAATFADKIEEKIDYNAVFDPNTDIEAKIKDQFGDGGLDISWKWKFEGGVGQTDEADTALGNKAAEGDVDITIGLDITVTQID